MENACCRCCFAGFLVKQTCLSSLHAIRAAPGNAQYGRLGSGGRPLFIPRTIRLSRTFRLLLRGLSSPRNISQMIPSNVVRLSFKRETWYDQKDSGRRAEQYRREPFGIESPLKRAEESNCHCRASPAGRRILIIEGNESTRSPRHGPV